METQTKLFGRYSIFGKGLNSLYGKSSLKSKRKRLFPKWFGSKWVKNSSRQYTQKESISPLGHISIIGNNWPVMRPLSNHLCRSTFYLTSVSRWSCTVQSREIPTPFAADAIDLDRNPGICDPTSSEEGDPWKVRGNVGWENGWVLWWVWTHRSEGHFAQDCRHQDFKTQLGACHSRCPLCSKGSWDASGFTVHV